MLSKYGIARPSFSSFLPVNVCVRCGSEKKYNIISSFSVVSMSSSSPHHCVFANVLCALMVVLLLLIRRCRRCRCVYVRSSIRFPRCHLFFHVGFAQTTIFSVSFTFFARTFFLLFEIAKICCWSVCLFGSNQAYVCLPRTHSPINDENRISNTAQIKRRHGMSVNESNQRRALNVKRGKLQIETHNCRWQ